MLKKLLLHIHRVLKKKKEKERTLQSVLSSEKKAGCRTVFTMLPIVLERKGYEFA